MQAAVLVAFALDPSDPPRAGSLFQALWALAHKPAFYPLTLVAVLGPFATWLACTVRGPHRRWLTACWVVFLAVLIGVYGHRVAVMLQLLWRHGGA